MIRTIRVKCYKSITDLTLELGRVTVLIGANGSGKSNILEALALAAACAQDKLDNEFLISRGIRVTETRFMRAAFSRCSANRPIVQKSAQEQKKGSSEKTRSPRDDIDIYARGDVGLDFHCQLVADETASYPKWTQRRAIRMEDIIVLLSAENLESGTPITPELLERVLNSEAMQRLFTRTAGGLPGFLVYAPENSSLRTFQAEGQILPLGIKGEGLFAHLKALSTPTHRVRLAKIREQLTLIDWFESFEFPEDLAPGERSIRIRDRYLPDGVLFDQRSANEGFLFLLFYLTLFISPDTPAFFSIDNIDSSLNPKLCITLLRTLTQLAKEYNKQVILTTHNPAVLDGLNLQDEEQRLVVVDRNKDGPTRVHRIGPPKPVDGRPLVSLSEAFMRGYIGGLPKNF
jgi:energy-coupling factor transporter ATP-binding protein EcfA2